MNGVASEAQATGARRIGRLYGVYDAGVLYPAAVLDLVVELGQTGLIRARWIARIHAKWMNRWQWNANSIPCV